MNDDSEDLDLVAAIRAGSTNAFGLLATKYQTRVRTYCYNVLLDRTASEDAAQEVFFKMHSRLDSFRGESLFSTWLYRVAVNHCRDLRRRNRRFLALSWDQLGAAKQDIVSHDTSRLTPEHSLEARDTVTKVFSQLSPDHREVLCLRDVHDLSYEQIAKALDCSLDAVKGKLKRARAELLTISRSIFAEPEDNTVSERGSR